MLVIGKVVKLMFVNLVWVCDMSFKFDIIFYFCIWVLIDG